MRPQNTIREPPLTFRYDEYPRLAQLTKLKDEIVASRATPPMGLRADLKTLDLKSLGGKFDVILIDPPLPEYVCVYIVVFVHNEQIQAVNTILCMSGMQENLL